MTTSVKGEGLLAHHFHGSYWAAVALRFDSAAHANDALITLGEPWEVGTNPTILIANVDSTGLDRLKAVLGTFGADVRKIDSVARSIDHGEPFTVDVPITAAEQLSLDV